MTKTTTTTTTLVLLLPIVACSPSMLEQVCSLCIRRMPWVAHVRALCAWSISPLALTVLLGLLGAFEWQLDAELFEKAVVMDVMHAICL